MHRACGFDTQAEEAANFYFSIFKDSKIRKISRYTKAGPRLVFTNIVVDQEGKHLLEEKP